MIILEQTTEKKSFTFTPRSLYKGNILTFENLATNQIQTVNDAEFYINDYYVCVDLIVDLKEGKDYKLTVKQDSEIVYIGFVFCTNQGKNYYINSEQITNTNSNTIIYE